MSPELAQVLGPLLVAGGTALAGLASWALLRLAQYLRMRTDDSLRAYVQEAVTSAVQFGVNQLRARIAGAPTEPVHWREVETHAIAYVLAHVPDALRALGLTPGSVENLVRARLDAQSDAPLPMPMAAPVPSLPALKSLLALGLVLPLAACGWNVSTLLSAAPAALVCVVDGYGKVLAIAEAADPDSVKAANAAIAAGGTLVHDSACQQALAVAQRAAAGG